MSQTLSEKFNDAIVHFVIGSSPIMSIFPFLILYDTYNRLPESERPVQLSTLFLVIPLIYGLLFAFTYALLYGIIPRKIRDTYFEFVFCGALSAFLTSIIVDMTWHIYGTVFQEDEPFKYHFAIFAFYFLLYFTFGQWIRAQILFGPPKSSSSSSSSMQSMPIKMPPKMSTSEANFDMIKNRIGKT